MRAKKAQTRAVKRKNVKTKAPPIMHDGMDNSDSLASDGLLGCVRVCFEDMLVQRERLLDKSKLDDDSASGDPEADAAAQQRAIAEAAEAAEKEFKAKRAKRKKFKRVAQTLLNILRNKVRRRCLRRCW